MSLKALCDGFITSQSPHSGGAAVILLHLDNLPGVELEWSRLGVERALQARVVAECRDDLGRIAATNLNVASALFWRGDSSLADVVRLHGTPALFTEVFVAPFDFGYVPLGERIVGLALRAAQRGEAALDLRHKLSELGRLLAATPPPWHRGDEIADPFFLQDLGSDFLESIDDPDALFAILAVFAASAESRQSPSGSFRDAALPALVHAVLHRNAGEASRLLEKLPLTSMQREFWLSWLRGNLNLSSAKGAPVDTVGGRGFQ